METGEDPTWQKASATLTGMGRAYPDWKFQAVLYQARVYFIGPGPYLTVGYHHLELELRQPPGGGELPVIPGNSPYDLVVYTRYGQDSGTVFLPYDTKPGDRSITLVAREREFEMAPRYLRRREDGSRILR